MRLQNCMEVTSENTPLNIFDELHKDLRTIENNHSIYPLKIIFTF